jgi:hypothetical protein
MCQQIHIYNIQQMEEDSYQGVKFIPRKLRDCPECELRSDGAKSVKPII